MTRIGESLVQFAVSAPRAVPDRLRAVFSGLAASTTPSSLTVDYPEGDLRAHALDHAAGLVRSGARPLVAATLAAATLRRQDNAPDAAVLGCEVTCRLAALLEAEPDDLPVVGAALAGSIGRRAGHHALGLALTQVTTVRGADEGPEARALRTAFAAADGIEAALLGERGFTAPEQPIEGRRGVVALLAPSADAQDLLHDLGTHWLAERLLSEPRGAHFSRS